MAGPGARPAPGAGPTRVGHELWTLSHEPSNMHQAIRVSGYQAINHEALTMNNRSINYSCACEKRLGQIWLEPELLPDFCQIFEPLAAMKCALGSMRTRFYVRFRSVSRSTVKNTIATFRIFEKHEKWKDVRRTEIVVCYNLLNESICWKWS